MNKLFTKSTFLAISVAAALFAQNANAKIGKTNVDNTPAKTEYNFDLLSELNSVIKNVVSDVEQPSIKKTIKKQLTADSVKLQTNKLVNEIDNTLPKFKFKVVIKD